MEEAVEAQSVPLRARAKNGQFPPALGTPWKVIQDAAFSVMHHGDFVAAREAILGALTATKWVRTGKDTWAEVPDHAIRGPVGLKFAEHFIGKAVERVEVSTAGADGQQSGISPAQLARLVGDRPQLAADIINALIANTKSAEVVELPGDNPTKPGQPSDS